MLDLFGLFISTLSLGWRLRRRYSMAVILDLKCLVVLIHQLMLLGVDLLSIRYLRGICLDWVRLICKIYKLLRFLMLRKILIIVYNHLHFKALHLEKINFFLQFLNDFLLLIRRLINNLIPNRWHRLIRSMPYNFLEKLLIILGQHRDFGV